MTTDIAIRTEHLTREFETVTAVDDLTFDVETGTVFGFLGPNGSGKTTTIRLLLGLLEPTSGTAQVLGYDTRTQSDEIRLRTGALLEHPGLYERLSAEDNLDFYGRVWHLSATERRERMKELLTHLNLWERRKERVAGWSRGMRQKLAIARVLMHHPPLIFLDEPTAGLDPVAAASLREDLVILAATRGVTIFVTTHNLAEAERLCSRVGVIQNGGLIATGSPDDLNAQAFSRRIEIVAAGVTDDTLQQLRARPEVASVSIESEHLQIALDNGHSVAPLVNFLVQSGIRIEEVRKVRASLEESFLTLVKDQE